MGIPSYFSYIIKNHANIIRKRRQITNKFSSLYMDCNSIIYDSVRKLEMDVEPRPAGFDMEREIIRNVITKIETYVNDIQPSNVLYIAFDGVAPFAKMEQQRVRRYKQGFLQPQSTKMFNTSSITPGTEFMKMLSLKVNRAFVESGRYFGAKTVIVSGSDKPGEGEHKMFQYMRDNALQTETIAVYGLDADLIMLGLFHCFACENIYIFRESPEFGRVLLGDSFAKDELLYLDNRRLASAILNEMGVVPESKDARGRIYDYVFMCFLLGNDFLPHFPSLNIRTHGNFTILETYCKLFTKYPDRRLISLESGNIQWRWVKVLLKEFSKEEHRNITNEYESRAKFEKRFYPTGTKEERDVAFENIPTIYRAEERYINPLELGWQKRYYQMAFHRDADKIDKTFIDSICYNYLEGLEWTFKYYTEGCPHWRWKYNHHYPPLFVDLVERVPDFETAFINETAGINLPFHPHTQLSYVIPSWNRHLLPKSHQTYLSSSDHSRYYVESDKLTFQWMFCKYFWESHAILPDIPLDVLEKMDVRNTTKK